MSRYGVFTERATVIAKAQGAAREFRRWGFAAEYTDEGVVIVKRLQGVSREAWR